MRDEKTIREFAEWYQGRYQELMKSVETGNLAAAIPAAAMRAQAGALKWVLND